MALAQQTAQAVQVSFSPLRVGLVVAGFDIPHAHVHVIPMHDYHDISSKRMLDGRMARPGYRPGPDPGITATPPVMSSSSATVRRSSNVSES